MGATLLNYLVVSRFNYEANYEDYYEAKVFIHQNDKIIEFHRLYFVGAIGVGTGGPGGPWPPTSQ